MSEEKTDVTEKQDSAGLKLNKKTMVSIFIVLLAVFVFAGAMTQILPRGEFQRTESGQIINGTYAENPDYKIPIWKVVLSPILCLSSEQAVTGIAIILFIVLIGGAFLILDKCGTMKYIMAFLVEKFGKQKYLLLRELIIITV